MRRSEDFSKQARTGGQAATREIDSVVSYLEFPLIRVTFSTLNCSLKHGLNICDLGGVGFEYGGKVTLAVRHSLL